MLFKYLQMLQGLQRKAHSELALLQTQQVAKSASLRVSDFDPCTPTKSIKISSTALCTSRFSRFTNFSHSSPVTPVPRAFMVMHKLPKRKQSLVNSNCERYWKVTIHQCGLHVYIGCNSKLEWVSFWLARFPLLHKARHSQTKNERRLGSQPSSWEANSYAEKQTSIAQWAYWSFKQKTFKNECSLFHDALDAILYTWTETPRIQLASTSFFN